MFHKGKTTLMYKLLPFCFYCIYLCILHTSSFPLCQYLWKVGSSQLTRPFHCLSIVRKGGCAGIEKGCLIVTKKVSNVIQFPLRYYLTYLQFYNNFFNELVRGLNSHIRFKFMESRQLLLSIWGMSVSAIYESAVWPL